MRAMPSPNTPAQQPAPAAQSGKWYTIRARAMLAVAAAAVIAGATTAPLAASEIYIYGDIGESWWEETVTAKSFIAELNALDVDDITVRIASIGGSVPDGVAIYNALKRHKAKVTTCVDSFAYSIASLIAMAGDEREMADNAVMMIHAPWTYTGGNAAELRMTADLLDTYAKAMATSYAAATGRTTAVVMSQWLTDGADHYFTAEDALAAGLITRTTSSLPVQASGARGLDLSRYRTPQAMAQRLGLPAPATAPAAPNAPTTTVTPTAAAAAQPPRTSMPNPTQTAATDEALAAARAEATQAEASRRTEVRAAFQPFASRNDIDQTELASLREQCENDTTITPEAAGKKLLALMAKGAGPANPTGGPRIETVSDEADKFRAAAGESIMARAGSVARDGKRVVASTANPLRGRKLLAIAEACLRRIGVNPDGMDQMQVVARAFTQSGSDFPILLETTMHKVLQAAYATQSDTWSLFCGIGSVSDFRAHNRYRTGSFGNLDSLTELGEFKNKTIPDGERASITAGTKGNIINLSRQAIINDDLSAFSSLAAGLGRAARRTIESDVYALVNTPGNYSDGVAVFHATHGNLAGAGAAPSVAAFDAVRTAMANQKDVSGNDFLDIQPSIWLGPVGLKGDADVINQSRYDPDASNKLERVNKALGIFSRTIGSPRLTGTAWYAFCDPMIAPALEVAFLDGNQEPYLENENGFQVDGTRWKVRHDYGIAWVEFKSSYRNPGA